MPLALHEDRRGVVYFACPVDEIFQTAPAGSPASYANWQAQEETGYEWVPQGYTSYDPNIPQDGEYAWTVGCGPAEQGLKPYTSILNFPMQQANYQSLIINPWQAILPDDDPYIPFPLQDIPADATITSTTWGFRMLAEPTEWTYKVNTLSHNNTVIPSISGPTTTVPDSWLTLIEHIDIVGLYPSSVNARDAILQDFNMQIGFKHYSGTGAPSTPHALKMAYFFFKAAWQGMDAINVTQWDDVTCAFGMTLAGDIERGRILAGSLAASMAATADVNLIGNLAGDLDASMSNIVDATNNEGGVDNGIDNTGWFNGDLALAADMVGQLRIDSHEDFSMSMTMTGEIEAIRNLSGSFNASIETFTGAMIKDGRLWVEEDSLAMSMTLNTPEVVRDRALIGAFPCGMALAGDLVAEIQLAGSLEAGMSIAGNLPSIISLEGAFNASMSHSATIAMIVDMSATFDANMSFWAGITYDYNEPALSENTYTMQARDRTIYLKRRENVIVMNTRKRN